MKLRCVALLYVLFAMQHIANSQGNGEIILMDFVKIKEGKKAEAMFFYENNWKIYREEAIRKKIIKSFQIVEAIPDSINNFDLILITVYKDSAQYLRSEENFRPILAAIRPNGPALLNDLKPEAFRQNLFARVLNTLYQSKTKKRKS